MDSFRRQITVLLCTSITSFFTSFMASSLNVALRQILETRPELSE